MLSERLALLVSLDSKGAVRGLNDLGKAADRNLSRLDDGAARTNERFRRAGIGMVATGGLIAGGLFKAAQASEDAKLSLLKLENTLKNNPRLAGESADSFTELAAAIQDKTAADGDAIVAGQAMLGTFKVTGDQIRKLTPLVVDYARKFGVDLVSANAQVGKALDGNVSALKRNGVSIDEAMFKTDRYAAVQKALAEQVGGFSVAEGATFAGSLERLKNELGDLAEGVGGGAVDAFSSMFNVVGDVAGAVEGLDPKLQGIVGKVAAFGATGLVVGGSISWMAAKVGVAADGFRIVGDGAKRLVDKFRPLNTAVGNTSASVSNLYAGTSRLPGIMTGAAAAVGVLGVVLANNASKAAQLRAAVASLRDEVEQTGDSLEQVARRQFVDAVTSSDSAREAMTRLGVSWKELGGLVTGSRDDIDTWKSEMIRAGEAAGMSQGHVSALTSKVYRANQAFDEAGKATAAAERGMSELGPSAGTAADGLTDVEDAADDAGEEVKTLGDRIGDLQDALNKLTDPVFAAEDAFVDLKEAQQKVIDAEAEFGQNAPQALQARRDATRAAADYESSLLGLEQAVRDGDVTSSEYIDTLKRWVDQGRITQKQADEAAYSFGVLADKAESAPEEVLTTVKTPGLSQAILDMETLRNRIAQLPRTIQIAANISAAKTGLPLIGDGNAQGGPIYRARGGPSGTDTVPAWLTPGEFVVRKPAVDKLGLATMKAINQGHLPSSGPVNVTIHTGANPQDVVEALKRWTRTNGPVPIAVAS